MTAFPGDRPADLDDLDTIAAHDWSAFRALSHVDTHWQRPGWTPRRSSYRWVVTFEDHPAVAEHVRRCRSAVPSAGYDVAAVDSVHPTIGRVAFTMICPRRPCGRWRVPPSRPPRVRSAST